MAKKSTTVNEYLTPSERRERQGQKSSRSLAALIHRAGRHDAWTASLRALLDPRIAAHCWVANLNGSTMTIYVSTAAWATKLRFDVPRLLTDLNALEDFRHLKDIRIKAQPIPAFDPPETAKVDRDAPPKELLESLAADTDDPALRAALERLARVEPRRD